MPGWLRPPAGRRWLRRGDACRAVGHWSSGGGGSCGSTSTGPASLGWVAGGRASSRPRRCLRRG